MPEQGQGNQKEATPVGVALTPHVTAVVPLWFAACSDPHPLFSFLARSPVLYSSFVFLPGSVQASGKLATAGPNAQPRVKSGAEPE